MKVFALSAIAGTALALPQEIVDISRRLGLKDNAVAPRSKWWRDEDGQVNPEALEARKHCQRNFAQYVEDASMSVTRAEAFEISECVANHAGKDLHKIFEDPLAEACYNTESYQHFDEAYTPEMHDCMRDAARFRNVCEEELEEVPWVRRLLPKLANMEEFAGCFYQASQMVWGTPREELGDEFTTTYDLAWRAMGPCLKQAGQREGMGGFTQGDIRALRLWFKRNCRLSMHSADNSPCGDQRWNDDFSCSDCPEGWKGANCDEIDI